MEKIMKKINRSISVIMILAAVSVISACGNTKEDMKPSAVQTEVSSEKSVAGADEEQTGARVSDRTAAGTAAADETLSEDISRNEAGEDIPAGDMDRKTLDAFTDLLNSRDYNGYLRSYYDNILEADLTQIFYNGGGLKSQAGSQTEINDYLAYMDEPELMTDLVRLTSDEIDGKLKKDTGYAFKDFKDNGNQTMEWTYLKKYDAYYAEMGDTNLFQTECISGRWMTDGTASVTYTGYMDYDENEDQATVTMAYKGTLDGLLEGKPESIQIISNLSDDPADNAKIDLNDDVVSHFTSDADTSVIETYMKQYSYKGDYSDIMSDKTRFYGLWYDPVNHETLYITEYGAQVYIPYLDYYGIDMWSWDLTDRTASGKCPRLSFSGSSDQEGLAYYIGGITEDLLWNYDRSQIFYRQKISGAD